jgi:chaperonin GroES
MTFDGIRDRTTSRAGRKKSVKSSILKTMKAVGKKVIIKVTGQKYEGKIIIPDAAQEKAYIGIVKSVGDDPEIPVMEIHAGVKVLFAKYAVTEFEVDGELFVVGEYNIVLAILEHGKRK